MKFKETYLRDEFKDLLHNDVRIVVEALDVWSRENGIPEVVVTEVHRTIPQQQAIYTRHADQLIYRLKIGDPDLDGQELDLAKELMDLSRDAVMAWARRRFSWHLCNCAVDIRSRNYSKDQLGAVMSFLAKRCPRKLTREEERAGHLSWELLEHDVAGAHVHLGVRDQSKRDTVH